MCTVVNNEDVQTVHHEQGHLFYDMHYHVQPKLFRDGAADFFHEVSEPWGFIHSMLNFG
jgi:peptidyl-dipeptidase A